MELCAECGCAHSDPTDYLCEGCRAAVCGCKSTPTFGIVDARDPRCFGGHVSARDEYIQDGSGMTVTRYIRHDPMRHEKGCSYAK